MIARNLRPVLLTCALMFATAAFASGGGMGGTSMGMGAGMGESPSATTPQYDPSVEYQKGLTDLQAGKFRDAQRDFDHVLASLPHDADTLFYSGMSKAGLG